MTKGIAKKTLMTIKLGALYRNILMRTKLEALSLNS